MTAGGGEGHAEDERHGITSASVPPLSHKWQGPIFHVHILRVGSPTVLSSGPAPLCFLCELKDSLCKVLPPVKDGAHFSEHGSW